MRALHAVDGMLTVSITPLPRDSSATEIRGRLLAARACQGWDTPSKRAICAMSWRNWKTGAVSSTCSGRRPTW